MPGKRYAATALPAAVPRKWGGTASCAKLHLLPKGHRPASSMWLHRILCARAGRTVQAQEACSALPHWKQYADAAMDPGRT